MECESIQKDKYIIYNEDYKILVFTSIYSRKTMKILIPSLSEYDVDDKKDFYCSIKNLFVNEDLCYLGQDISTRMVYKAENRKMKKHTLQIIRNYYSCYKKMKDLDYTLLIEICYKNDVLPYFLTIEELKQLIIKRKLVLDDIDVDTSMYGSLEELQKRLNFEKC